MALQQVAEAAGATFLPLFNDVPADWISRCLYSDGLHPNDAGHQWIFERLRASIDTVLA
jgi:lysophospholipase L1-like esterase